MSQNRSHRILFTALTLAVALPATALAQSSLLSTPWYIGGNVGVVVPESLRGVSTGGQGRLLVGIPLRPQAFLEVSGFGISAEGKDGAPKETTLGGGLDLRLESLGEKFNFLFLVGAGYSQAKRDEVKVNAPYVNVGWGVETDLLPSLSLRTELRGLARFGDEFIAGRGVTYDAMASVGLVKRFGRRPTESNRAAPPPVAPPPVAPALQSPALPPQPPVPAPAVAAPAIDYLSGCPAAPANAKTDASGCLVAQNYVLPRSRLLQGEGGSLSDEADAVLAPFAAALRRQPGLGLELVVHTDTLGQQSYNLDLTIKMAERLRDRLVELGAPAGQIETIGAGESEPIANEIDEAGRDRNRRVELNLRPR
ncbi:MAG: OmpA family protein [Nevskiaceae bacterium]|nr:MAG: OmpA family protein [Nevskiaceae bacterium]TAM24953.1 MAG: OmpA family protein [Nevskiaceae bacterium]